MLHKGTLLKHGGFGGGGGGRAKFFLHSSIWGGGGDFLPMYSREGGGDFFRQLILPNHHPFPSRK